MKRSLLIQNKARVASRGTATAHSQAASNWLTIQLAKEALESPHNPEEVATSSQIGNCQTFRMTCAH